MGESYCHGECEWKNNSCQERTMLQAFYGEFLLVCVNNVHIVSWMTSVYFFLLSRTGCPLCLSGVRENVPVSLSRCEKVFLIWNTPLLKYLKYSTSEVCDFFGFHFLKIPQPHNTWGGRAANGWIWFLLWGWKHETNRQAKLFGICITKKPQNLFGIKVSQISWSGSIARGQLGTPWWRRARGRWRTPWNWSAGRGWPPWSWLPWSSWSSSALYSGKSWSQWVRRRETRTGGRRFSILIRLDFRSKAGVKKTLIGSFWTLTASLVAGGLETFRAQSGRTSLRHHRDDPPWHGVPGEVKYCS